MTIESLPRARILLAINGLDYGGTETAVAQLAGELSARGHDVEVLCMKRIGRLGQDLSRRGIPVGSLEMGDAVSLRGAVAAFRDLSTFLGARPFDVVHSFLPRANVLTRVANRLSRAPSLHVSSERSTDLKRPRVVSAFGRYTMRWTDLVLAVSPSVRDVLHVRERIPLDKVEILGNGIDLDAVDAAARTEVRSELRLTPDDLLVCSVGRLVPDKGHIYLVRALARLPRVRLDPQLVIVGEGPERARIEEEVARLGLRSRVHLLGFRSDVVGILKACDLFVLPSLEEGLPVTALEAMACRLAVIATDVGDVADLIGKPGAGLLVRPAERWRSSAGKRRSARSQEPVAAEAAENGVADLAAAIATLAVDPQRRTELGRAGRRVVEGSHSLRAVASRVESHYRALLDQRRRRAPAGADAS